MTVCEWCEREGVPTRLCMVRTTDGSTDGPFDICRWCEGVTDTVPYAEYANGEYAGDPLLAEAVQNLRDAGLLDG